MNIDLDKIGNFLYDLRNSKSLTQEELASLVGVSFKTISKWECGGSFPDVIYQKPLCDALGITLEELQMGEYNTKERTKQKVYSIFTKIAIVIFLILIPILFGLTIYFVSHYNKSKIYPIIQHHDYEDIAGVNGLIVESYKNNYIYISDIDLYDFDIDEKDIISVDLYSKDRIIYHKNVIEPFIVRYTYCNEIDKDNLKLIVTVSDLNGNDHVFAIKIILNDSYNVTNILKDNKEYFRENDYELIDRLKKAGFENVHDDIWRKNNNDKTINVEISLLNKQISFAENNDVLLKQVIYYCKWNSLDVYIYSKDSSLVLVEKYRYHYDEDKYDCQIGMCTSVEKISEMMNEYITLLNGE